jgi:HK97 family phage major capsid protein
MKTDPPFSITAMLRAMKAQTWAKIDSPEFRMNCELNERYGIPDTGGYRIPCHAFNTRATPLTAASATGGGFLDSTNLQGYWPALQPMMVLGRVGTKSVLFAKGDAVIPRGTAPIPVTWLTNEGTATTAQTLALAQFAFSRRTIVVTVPVSRQLLLQSNADEVVPLELARGAAAGIDQAGLQGLGTAGVPLGLFNNPAITSASGASVAYSTMVSMMDAVANANADPDSLGWLTTPNVAGLLKQRYFSTANFPIWTGSVPAGTIDNQTAVSTTNCPTGSLIHGNFSQLLMAQWTDGLQIDLDPYTNFQNAVVVVRLAVACDFAVANPTAFSILTNVT